MTARNESEPHAGNFLGITTYPAIIAADLKAFICQDDKIIGECFSVAYTENDSSGHLMERSQCHVDVQLTGDESRILIRNTKAWNSVQSTKLIKLNYKCLTGEYIKNYFSGDEGKELDSIFQHTRVVCLMGFEIGACPKYFENTPGYRSRLGRMWSKFGQLMSDGKLNN